MTSALSIFFKNFECSCNEDDDDDEDQHHDDDHDEEEGNAAVARSNHSNEEEENDEEDNKSLSEISAASTTKSLPISAFHIQIVSDNAISSVTAGVHHDYFSSDPTCTSSINTTTTPNTPLLPQRRHSTPVPLLHSQGRRIPRPVHPQSTSESLLSRRWKKWHDQRHHGCDAFPDIVARRRATKKSPASSLLPYSASPVSSNSSSSCSLLVSSSSSR